MKARPLPAAWSYVASYLACLPPLPGDSLPCVLRRSCGTRIVTPRAYLRAVEAASPEPVAWHFLPTTAPIHEDQIT